MIHKDRLVTAGFACESARRLVTAGFASRRGPRSTAGFASNCHGHGVFAVFRRGGHHRAARPGSTRELENRAALPCRACPPCWAVTMALSLPRRESESIMIIIIDWRVPRPASHMSHVAAAGGTLACLGIASLRTRDEAELP